LTSGFACSVGFSGSDVHAVSSASRIRPGAIPVERIQQNFFLVFIPCDGSLRVSFAQGAWARLAVFMAVLPDKTYVDLFAATF
jgi:hypothetical protein